MDGQIDRQTRGDMDVIDGQTVGYIDGQIDGSKWTCLFVGFIGIGPRATSI